MAEEFRIVLHDVIYLEANGLQDAIGLAVQSASDYAKELGEDVTATVWRTTGVLVGTSVGRPDGMADWITVEDHAATPVERPDPDGLPAFEPAVWALACHETAWVTSQVQGFQYETVDGGYAMVVRDCLRPADLQVLWREHVTAAMLEEARDAATEAALYGAVHQRMTLFIATHATAIVAERYRELRRSQL